MSAPRRTQRARRFLGRFIAFCGGAGVWECDNNIIFDCSAHGFEVCSPNVVDWKQGCRGSRRTAPGHK
ncbi:MAG: hypothetical protein O8C66_08150 [Candidatus Methanoperedens sp.]|nr:hypothetical protein [Candidatus Methanoperedens sp.]MCZ7370467.1 hypothetical protein [Candidatus Methanoperedens sp.]